MLQSCSSAAKRLADGIFAAQSILQSLRKQHAPRSSSWISLREYSLIRCENRRFINHAQSERKTTLGLRSNSWISPREYNIYEHDLEKSANVYTNAALHACIDLILTNCRSISDNCTDSVDTILKFGDHRLQYDRPIDLQNIEGLVTNCFQTCRRMDNDTGVIYGAGVAVASFRPTRVI